MSSSMPCPYLPVIAQMNWICPQLSGELFHVLCHLDDTCAMHWAMQCNDTGQMHSIAIIIIMAQLCGGITTPPVQSENEQQMHLLKPQVLTPTTYRWTQMNLKPGIFAKLAIIRQSLIIGKRHRVPGQWFGALYAFDLCCRGPEGQSPTFSVQRFKR